MGIGTSIFLIAVGAILRYAVTATVQGVELQTVGLILMIVGIIGLVISLAVMFLGVSTGGRRTSTPRGDTIDRVGTGARRDRAERAAAAPPTVEPEPGNAGEGKVMSSPRSTRYDAVVIGAGLVGLACAWSAGRRGLSVLVVERAGAAAAGSSGVAAGMLAPVTEADFGEEAALALGLGGARALAVLRGAARGGDRPLDRLPRERCAGGGRRPRRRGGAAPPARAAPVARARLRMAPAVALPARSSRGCRRGSPGGMLAAGDAQADPRATALRARRGGGRDRVRLRRQRRSSTTASA